MQGVLKRRLLGMLAATSLCTTVACVSISPPPTPEALVRERATQRWRALIANDMPGAYQFTPPSYRAVASLDVFKGQFGNAVIWVAGEVVSVTCEPEKCTSVVRVEAKPLLGKRFGNTLVTHVNETWLLEDATWWFFQKL
jgi:hypothetical protein